MKKILAVLLLVPGIAFASKEWTGTFKLKTGDEAEHTPQSVRWGFMRSGKSISMSKGTNINGNTLSNALDLKVDQTKEEFVAALVKAGLLDPTKSKTIQDI